MNPVRALERQRPLSFATIACVALLLACSPEETPAPADARTDFASRYAAAWSGLDPVQFGEFYEADGSLIVNGSASVGRNAIVETARSYMVAFPDMVVRLDSLREEQGKTVRLNGYERWTFGPNGLLRTSDGHFDDDEYQRQLRGEPDVTR